MNGVAHVSWSGVALAVSGEWRLWAGLRTGWPEAVTAGGTWLRRVWQRQHADGQGGTRGSWED
ncbi:MAG TPA: hypothetical protein VF579_11185 [Candidatus Methylomirabilis sp.]